MIQSPVNTKCLFLIMSTPKTDTLSGIIIYGISPLIKEVIHIFQQNDMFIYGILTDDASKLHTSISDIPILGREDDDQFLQLVNESCPIFVACDNIRSKKDKVNYLTDKKIPFVISAIHPSAVLATDICLGSGNYVDALSHLSPDVRLGNHCIIQSGVMIETGTQIGDFVTIGSGSVICTGAIIEEEAYIGPRSVIMPNAQIAKGMHIAAGSIIT